MVADKFVELREVVALIDFEFGELDVGDSFVAVYGVFLETDLNVVMLRVVGKDVEKSEIVDQYVKELVEVGLYAVVAQVKGVGSDAATKFVGDLDVVAVGLLFVVDDVDWQLVVQDDLEVVVFEFVNVDVVDVTDFVVKGVVVVDCVETFAVDVDSENTD